MEVTASTALLMPSSWKPYPAHAPASQMPPWPCAPAAAAGAAQRGVRAGRQAVGGAGTGLPAERQQQRRITAGCHWHGHMCATHAWPHRRLTLRAHLRRRQRALRGIRGKAEHGVRQGQAPARLVLCGSTGSS